MDTEFWGVEVKNGEFLKVSPGYGMVLHLSQASLGEHKNEKGKESVSLFVNIDGKKLVLGTLITNKLPQHQFDLLFERDFELSHDWKNGSVYFYGYKASKSLGEDELPEGESDESESVEDIPINLANNGKPESKAKQEKPESKAEQQKPESKAEQQKPESKAEQMIPESRAEPDRPPDPEKANTPNEKSDAGRDPVKIVETHKDMIPQDDDESSYEDLMSDDDDPQDFVESNDKSDKRGKETRKKFADKRDKQTPKKFADKRVKQTPKKVDTNKKRPVESAAKTPIPDKKAKVTPQGTDGDKPTPLPGKEAETTPADEPNKQTPKSGKSYPCKMCNRTFGSEQGVEDHTKAKHGDGK